MFGLAGLPFLQLSLDGSPVAVRTIVAQCKCLTLTVESVST